MNLNALQFEFSRNVPALVLHIYEQDYTCSYGDTWAFNLWPVINLLERIGTNEKLVKFLRSKTHKINSLHYKRLAIDINLFHNGTYLTKTSDHKFAGDFWESLHIQNRWGGRYRDGNHYELVPYEWRPNR